MVEEILYEALDKLADKYIPEGQHKLLHVNSREVWKDLIMDMVERGSLKPRLSILTKCAMYWEALLIQKISIQN